MERPKVRLSKYCFDVKIQNFRVFFAGMLQSLQQTASTFAGMVTSFCAKLGWRSLELLVGQFQDRLQFGIHRELIDLCRISCLNGQRARVLFNADIDSVAILANSKIEDIENLLQNCAPFESGKAGEGESDRLARERKTLRSFWVTGLKGVTEAEAAKMIVEEAREILQKDLGVEISNWGNANIPEVGNSSRRLSSPSYHMSYLKNNSVGKPSKKSAKNSRNSRLKKSRNNSRKKNSYEVTSKSVAKKSNLSFDISAQMEELFEITKDDKNIEDEHFEKDKENFQVLGNLVRNQDSGFCQPKSSKIETSEKSKKCVPKNDFQILGNLVKNQDSGLSKNEKSSKIDTSEKSKNDFQVLGNLVKNQVSGSSIENSEKSKKRVSWGDEEIQFSPCKKAKIQSDETTTQDIFADSFVDLDDLDENLEGSNLITNKSCPKTPKFEACSEKFLVEKDENTISDSFLEAAFNSHLTEFDHQTQSKVNKLSTPIDPYTPSPRSKRLQERRKLAKKAKNQQNIISPGFIQSDESENESENFENLKAIPKIEDPIFKRPDDFKQQRKSIEKQNESNASQCNLEVLNVIDVCTNRTRFETFKEEILEKSEFSMTLAIGKSNEENTTK